jgi:hypothetical protein
MRRTFFSPNLSDRVWVLWGIVMEYVACTNYHYDPNVKNSSDALPSNAT